MKNLLLYIVIIVFYGCEIKQFEDKPNILMICIDDLNDWIGFYDGHPNSKTPNIDGLANESIVFMNTYAQAPVCIPSRTSVLTGLRPSTSGSYKSHPKTDKELMKLSKKNNAYLLHEYFKNHEYLNIGIGKISHKHMPKNILDISGGRGGGPRGFGPRSKETPYFNWHGQGSKERTQTDWAAFPESDSLMPDYFSAKWIKKRLNEYHESPFFMTVGFLRPHVPWYVPQKWFDMHPLDSIQLPPYYENDLDDLPESALLNTYIKDQFPTTEWAIKNNKWKNIIQAYLASVSFVDFYVGEVINALNNSNYRNNTIIILWSDHGYRLGEKGIFAKHGLWDEAIKVPLIIKPVGLKKGFKVHQNVELLDIYPTLIEMADLPPNSKNEGKSLVPLFVNDTLAKHKKYVLSTYGKNNHSITSENFKYILYSDGGEELYDLKDDPYSWFNLASNNDYNEIKTRLKNYIPINP